ncbi:tetratricopeptide repeat protein [Actinokineospora diospyrosa]|uniref:AAA ATPase domain-containing protein n=1 Tax=Actinokineospora diospyrosa TaxID=103728 RepID=A0ABT1I9K7_9PSEU|nr:tetratricopeptide repeat protein [Actinokineospora diospyrosa]MCP2269325.1 AAA ATPase domain-containing protein [Actinokineospora diospyrosa]
MSMPESHYVPRAAEGLLLAEIDQVRDTGQSKVVLLYGPGGVGKTRMLRALAAAGTRGATTWLEPLDVDDSEYWALENVQRRVAEGLDPDGIHFGDFLRYLTSAAATPGGGESALAVQTRTRAEFRRCYESFRDRTGATVVIPLDTVEVIRDSYLLTTLVAWMAELPATVFVLSGRPADGADTIAEQVSTAAGELTTAVLDLGGFTEQEGRLFLSDSEIGRRLPADLVTALVSLTEGHPLWLELAVDYLRGNSPPPETAVAPPHHEYQRESFRRTLITPFRGKGFWSEAIKRLAVVRHSVDQRVWQAIMADRPLPDDAPDWPRAWAALRSRPWIRLRANGQDVTLHDALAEELIRRLIPLHDHDTSWRRTLWAAAATAFAVEERSYDDVVNAIDATLVDDDPQERGSVKTQQLARLDVYKRRFDRQRAARLHYLLLSDFERGAEQVATEFRAAAARDDLRYMQLVHHEIRRFLPAGDQRPTFDAIGVVVQRFRLWLTGRPESWLDIALNVARYLVQTSQARPAVALLDGLPAVDDPELAYQVAREQGNAWMRLPGEIVVADRHFHAALGHAQSCAQPRRERLTAQARKELGFFARNIGRWDEADEHYGYASAAIKRAGAESEVLGEQASISTNWAYLKALRGDYAEADGLVSEALRVRKTLGSPLGIAISHSTAGEVCRYGQRFDEAWGHYLHAELLLVGMDNQPWLGQIYQEQAICLLQAAREGTDLEEDPLERAKELIDQALEICRERAIRWYPSALNRAGRIHSGDDADLGLRYLREAIWKAEAIADGWFQSASLIEFLELNYATWENTHDEVYRTTITQWAPKVLSTMEQFEFADLRPRWELINAHLAVHDALGQRQVSGLDDVARTYARALLTLNRNRVGSHGAAALDSEFDRFGELFARLPAPVRGQWYELLHAEWAVPARRLVERLDRLR